MAFAPPAGNPIAALIAHIQAARAGGGAPGGPPQTDQQEDANGSVTELISKMIDLGVQATQQEKDPVERAALSKIVAQLHQFAATEQKQRDAAMGAGPAVQMLRRTQG